MKIPQVTLDWREWVSFHNLNLPWMMAKSIQTASHR